MPPTYPLGRLAATGGPSGYDGTLGDALDLIAPVLAALGQSPRETRADPHHEVSSPFNLRAERELLPLEHLVDPDVIERAATRVEETAYHVQRLTSR